MFTEQKSDLGAVDTFQKGASSSAFLTCSQFPSSLAFHEPKLSPASKEREKKRKTKRHLKLNLKRCFFWTPVCEAINQGRHFHTPHFSWLRSEFPPFLALHLGFGYLLPYWLQTTGDGASAPREKPTSDPPPTPSGRVPVVLGLGDFGAWPHTTEEHFQRLRDFKVMPCACT